MRVLHLTGSAVSADLADLSRLYAADCLEAIGGLDGYEHRVAYVDPGGGWRFPDGLDDEALARAPVVPVGEAVARVAGLGVDVALPQLFCRPGMTVHRGLLDVLGIPYVGNPPDVMALGADKARARAVVAAAGVAVPEGEVVHAGERPSLMPSPGAALVVKPVDADNSDGVSLVRQPGEYAAALAAASAHSDRVLVERYIDLGREVRVGVLERDGDLHCLPLEEYAVDPVTKPVRDRADKLRRAGSGDLQLVAKDAEHAWILHPADPVTASVWALARAAHRALGCRDYSLFDVRVDPAGRPWFLEASLYCSFARTSVVAVMAQADGIGLPALFTTAVDRALARGRAVGGPVYRRPHDDGGPGGTGGRPGAGAAPGA